MSEDRADNIRGSLRAELIRDLALGELSHVQLCEKHGRAPQSIANFSSRNADEVRRAGLLLAAFAGLRLAEVCGLRVQDVDFLRGVVRPVVQYPAEPLKTDISRTPVPIPHDLVLELSRHVERFSTNWVMCDPAGHQMGPWQLQRAFRAARAHVVGLPEGFRFHDLRHYYASLLINSGLDVKVVRHGSGTHPRRPHWTPTGTCNRTLMRRPGPPSAQ